MASDKLRMKVIYDLANIKTEKTSRSQISMVFQVATLFDDSTPVQYAMLVRSAASRALTITTSLAVFFSSTARQQSRASYLSDSILTPQNVRPILEGSMFSCQRMSTLTSPPTV